jgi:hypothetical protein
LSELWEQTLCMPLVTLTVVCQHHAHNLPMESTKFTNKVPTSWRSTGNSVLWLPKSHKLQPQTKIHLWDCREKSTITMWREHDNECGHKLMSVAHKVSDHQLHLE